jgi:hypothetical protein
MDSQVRLFRFTITVLVFVSLIGLFGLMVVQAQDSQPTRTLYSTQTPTQAAADATEEANPHVDWTVGETTFTSNYPLGFSFAATITSSVGPVVRGRMVWSHAPGRQGTSPVEINSDTGELTATWDATGNAVPPWVGITYHWELEDNEGNQFETEAAYVEYEDNSHDWTRSESEDIIVFAENLPEDTGQMVLDAMAQQRETYRTAWGDLLPYKPRAILFGDQDAWQEWQIGTTNSRVIGVTDEDWGGTAQVVSNGDIVDLAYGTVLHEVAHLYQSSFTVMTAGSWLIEGDATFFEINQMYDYEQAVRNLAESGELPVLLQDTGPGVSGQYARRGYDIGYTFWKWLTDNYGLEAHRQLIDLLDTGMGRNQAIEQVTGLSTEEVESRWRVWLGASEVVPTLIPAPTLFMPVIVTPSH